MSKGGLMFRHSIQLLLFTFLVTCALAAAEDSFVGDWKLNPSKSKIFVQMKVESLGANKYAFDFGGDGNIETIVVDGTFQPGQSGTTLSVTAESPDAWKVVRKKDDRMLLTANWSLSKDGNTLTDHFTGFDAKGLPQPVDSVFQRRGGGSGFVGTWVSTSEAVNFVFSIQIRTEGGGLSISDSEGGTVKAKLDGKDYPFTGSNGPSGFSSGRRLDEHTVELTYKKADGKINRARQIKLSSDLKTLTMTTHTSGQSDPQILVFERQ